MTRLTETTERDGRRLFRLKGDCGYMEAGNTGDNRVMSAIEKLAEYEEAEEQGRLVRLPCKIGTRIYHAPLTGTVTEYTVDGVEIYKTDDYIVVSRYGDRRSFPAACLGNSWFLTLDEAEAVATKARKNHGT